MSPLVLQIKGSKSFIALVDLDSEEELSKTWQICTKVKDSLENGTRFENLSWRLWFRQQLSKHRTTATITIKQLDYHRSFDITTNNDRPPLSEEATTTFQAPCKTEGLDLPLTMTHPDHSSHSYTLPRFTLDQRTDQSVDLQDIFGSMNSDHLTDSIDEALFTDKLFTGLLCNTSTIINDDLEQQSTIALYPKETTDNDSGHLQVPVPASTVPLQPQQLPDTSSPFNDLFLHDNSPGSSAISAGYIDGINSTISSYHMMDFSNFNMQPMDWTSYATHSPAYPSLTTQQTLPAHNEYNTPPVCSNCSATSTPLWRRSPDDQLLCNACGLYQKLHNAPRPKTLKTLSSNKPPYEAQLECSNCTTTLTPLWRRDDEGAPLCNACGLYWKLHHQHRPISMKKNVIKKRQRYDGYGINGVQPARKTIKTPFPSL
ncbi:hypothetical protein [Absidia glauca]|uniref:GATA-type domain-containing protein n=1 Tax=Absidia glauca TaxID=4829 RepID=A0A168RV19_ABSGL|nr:hypothetical protein [Absidia glauca]